jgi:hypothetical protein
MKTIAEQPARHTTLPEFLLSYLREDYSSAFSPPSPSTPTIKSVQALNYVISMFMNSNGV